MRKIFLPLAAALCLLLTGCGSKAYQQQHQALQQRMGQSPVLSFRADIRAEYPDKTARFTLGYSRDESGAVVEILAPKLVAGVKARLEPDGSSLEYDGLMLGTGDLDSHGLSPMSCLPLLVSCLERGTLDSGSQDGADSVLELQDSDDLRCRVWLSGAELLPSRAELISEGRVMVFADIHDWQLGPAPETAAPSDTQEPE